jgi:hypothetical protein
MLAVLLLTLAPAGLSCGGGTAESCPRGVDALSDDLLAARTTVEIDSSIVKKSLSSCGGAAEWKVSADVDHIDRELSVLTDIDPNQPFTSNDEALAYLCDRYDTGNSTDTCKIR